MIVIEDFQKDRNHITRNGIKYGSREIIPLYLITKRLFI